MRCAFKSITVVITEENHLQKWKLYKIKRFSNRKPFKEHSHAFSNEESPIVIYDKLHKSIHNQIYSKILSKINAGHFLKQLPSICKTRSDPRLFNVNIE